MKKKENLGRIIQLIMLVGFCTSGALSQARPEHSYDINDLPFEAEMRRLDSAARELKSNPSKIVYLVGYNKTGEGKATATSRLKKSKAYLIRQHRLKPQRIRTFYAGEQNGLVMRIVITEKNAEESPSKPEDCAPDGRND